MLVFLVLLDSPMLQNLGWQASSPPKLAGGDESWLVAHHTSDDHDHDHDEMEEIDKIVPMELQHKGLERVA